MNFNHSKRLAGRASSRIARRRPLAVALTAAPALLALLLLPLFARHSLSAQQGEDFMLMLPIISGGNGLVEENAPPVAAADVYHVTEDAPLVVGAAAGVLANDSDPDGDPLQAVLQTDVSNGQLILSGDGSFTYEPAAGFVGRDSFSYRATDGDLSSAAVNVTLIVGDANAAPVAVADAYITQQDTTLNVDAAAGVLANDSDLDGDPLQAVLESAPGNGALTLNADGSFTYEPAAGFAGDDAFSYRATDGDLSSAPATVTITVEEGGSANLPPYFVTGAVTFGKRVIGEGVLGTHIAVGADLDGDGDMDIAATDYENGRVVWYQNDGTGQYAEADLDPDLEGAYPAAVGDVDGDGDMDLLVAGYLSDTFVWYRNDGGGNFTRIDIDNNSDGAHSIITVDLDRDGDMDLVTSSQDAGTIAWYENDGANNFERHIVNDDTPDAKRAEVADMDGDGDIDIVVAGFRNNEIAWLENDGAQNFTKHIIYDNALGAYYAVAADVDGDGDMDVFSASRIDATFALYRNDGAQNFSYEPLYTKAPGARTIISVDLDGDGDMDALSASLNDHTVAWFENNGQGKFTRRPIDTDVRGAYGVFAADMDLDGNLDVLSAGRNSDDVSLHTQRHGHSARVAAGATKVINTALLQALDDANGPEELVYTLMAAPAAGNLRLGGAALAQGATFTQADVDAGRLTYVHTATNKVDDAFTISVTDGTTTVSSLFKLDIR